MRQVPASRSGKAQPHPQLKTRLPNMTFEHELVIHGTHRTVELLPFIGHTASDIVLFLPEQEVAFLGDLLFINVHPYLASGFPDQWKRSLAKVEALGAQTVAPGHGPVGRSTDLSLMTQYIQSLQEIAVNLFKADKSIEKVPIPPPFNSWLQPFDNFFVANPKFLYKLARKK
jgi:cyclase